MIFEVSSISKRNKQERTIWLYAIIYAIYKIFGNSSVDDSFHAKTRLKWA